MAKRKSRKVQKPLNEAVEKENRFTFEVGEEVVEVKEIGLRETAQLIDLAVRVSGQKEFAWTPGDNPMTQVFKTILAHMGDPETLKELFAILTGKPPEFVEKHFRLGWGMAFLLGVISEEIGDYTEFFQARTELPS